MIHTIHAGSRAGAVTDSVRTWLRAEGLGMLALAVLLYARADYSWILFAILFFAPDLSFAAYLAGPRMGAMFYNLLHTEVGPLALAGILLITGTAVSVPLIWAAHVGFDRMLGYGLKYPSAFTDTHLGRIGKAPARQHEAGTSSIPDPDTG